MVYSQLKDSTCGFYPDNIQYKWNIYDRTEKKKYVDSPTY